MCPNQVPPPSPGQINTAVGTHCSGGRGAGGDTEYRGSAHLRIPPASPHSSRSRRSGEAGGVATWPSPRGHVCHRRGCGSRSLSSSAAVTPAAGAHTICSRSSRSCPQTARGAALLPGVRGPAGCRRRAQAGTGSGAGRQGWKGGGAGDSAVRLDATWRGETTPRWGDDAGKRRQHRRGMRHTPPSILTQGPGCATSPGDAGQGERPDPDPSYVTTAPPAPRRRSRFATPHRRHGGGSARRKRVQHRPARCCFLGWSVAAPRSPSPAR